MALKPQLTAHDFDRELLILFDARVHGGIGRRGFLEGAAKFATRAGRCTNPPPQFGQVLQNVHS